MTTATFEDGSPESLRLLFSISTVIVSGGEGMLRIERRVALVVFFEVTMVVVFVKVKAIFSKRGLRDFPRSREIHFYSKVQLKLYAAENTDSFLYQERFHQK